MIFSLGLYNSILLLSTLFVYLSEREKTAVGRKICLILAFLICTIPNAIRFEIGSDYNNYLYIFDLISRGYDLKGIEPGYKLINILIYKAGLGYEWLFAFVAIFIHILAFLSYPTKNKYIFHLFFMLFFYFESFNVLRQTMAMVVIMYALKQLTIENSNFKYYIRILLATTLHFSSLLFLLFPKLINKLFRKLYINFGWGTLLVWVLIFIAGSSLIGIISNLMGALPFLNYSSYLETYGSREFSLLYLAVFAIFYLYPFIFSKKIIQADKNNLLYFVILSAFVFFWAMSFNLSIFSRLVSLFKFAVVYIVYIVYNSSNIPFRRSYTLIFIIFLVYTFNVTISRSHTSSDVTCNPARLAPYVTIFNKEDSQRDSRIANARRCSL